MLAFPFEFGWTLHGMQRIVQSNDRRQSKEDAVKKWYPWSTDRACEKPSKKNHLTLKRPVERLADRLPPRRAFLRFTRRLEFATVSRLKSRSFGTIELANLHRLRYYPSNRTHRNRFEPFRISLSDCSCFIIPDERTVMRERFVSKLSWFNER